VPIPGRWFFNKFFLGERTAYSAALLPGCSNRRNLAACNQLLPFGPRSNVSVQRQWLNWWAEMLNTVVMPVYAPTPSRRLQLFSQPRELLRMPQLIPPTSAGRSDALSAADAAQQEICNRSCAQGYYKRAFCTEVCEVAQERSNAGPSHAVHTRRFGRPRVRSLLRRRVRVATIGSRRALASSARAALIRTGAAL
jgi:hypothetical protein